MPFRHDAGVFRPNGMSRRNFDGLKPPNPSSFGVRDGLGRKTEVQNPNRVSAKCAIRHFRQKINRGPPCVSPRTHMATPSWGTAPTGCRCLAQRASTSALSPSCTRATTLDRIKTGTPAPPVSRTRKSNNRNSKQNWQNQHRGGGGGGWLRGQERDKSKYNFRCFFGVYFCSPCRFFDKLAWPF
jgi:hypothetical protein